MPLADVASHYVLGFDIGGTKTSSTLANLQGELLAEAQASTVRWTGQADYGRFFTELRDTLLHNVGAPANKIRAVSVAVAGIVNPRTNHITMAPNISAGEFDLQSLIEDALGIPVLVENDVNLAAVGEHWRGAAKDCKHFVFLAIGTGIGSGVFINGHLYRGAHNAAGETGYLYVHGLEKIGPDGLGALERRASGVGIAAAARRLAEQNPSSTVLDPRSLTTSEVLQAAGDGDPVAAQVLDEALETLALGLANVAFLLDPEMIVLGGGVGRAGDTLLLPLRERLAELLIEPVAPRLELSQLGAKAQLYGAVRYALDYVDHELASC